MATCDKDSKNLNPNSVSTSKPIEVRGKQGEITVNKFNEGNSVIFQVELYKEFDISLKADPAVVEVGNSDVEVEFTGKIVEKDTEITSRSLTPNVAELSPLTVNDFTFIKSGVSSDVQGTFPAHQLEVIDKAGTKKTIIGGTKFYHKVYQGFSPLEELTKSDIKDLQNINIEESVFTSYGGSKDYDIPVNTFKQYIYWIFHKDTAPIIAARTGLLTFPLKQLNNITIESDVKSGLMLDMIVVRSANKFGSGVMNINLLKTIDEFELDDIEFITAN